MTAPPGSAGAESAREGGESQPPEPAWRALADFTLCGTGRGSDATSEVGQALQALAVPAAQRETIQAAVAEAVRKAGERSLAKGTAWPVRIRVFVASQPATPANPARGGWSYFLVENTAGQQTIELYVYQESEAAGSQHDSQHSAHSQD